MNLIYTCHSIVILMIIFFLNAPSYIDYIGAQSVSNSTTQNDTDITNSTTSEHDTDLVNKRLPLEAVLVTKNIAQNGTVMIDLPFENRQQPGANWTYVLDSLPLYGSILPFNEKGDQINNGIIPYKAAVNFSGVDYFGYKITDNISSTKPALISVTTYANIPLIDTPILRITVSILVARRFHNNNSSSCITNNNEIA